MLDDSCQLAPLSAAARSSPEFIFILVVVGGGDFLDGLTWRMKCQT